MNPVYAKAILDLEMPENDAGAKTVRQYLVALARQVWFEDEGFSGKRPFGNSGWSHELTNAVVAAGVAPDEHAAGPLITEILDLMFEGKVL
jgi:hypothetical protein